MTQMSKAPRRIHTPKTAIAAAVVSACLCSSSFAHDEAGTATARPARPCLADLAPLAPTAGPLTLAESSAFEIEAGDTRRFQLKGLVAETLINPDLMEKRQAAIEKFLERDPGSVQIFKATDARPDRYGRLKAFITSSNDSKTDTSKVETLQDYLLEEGLARVDPEPLTQSCAKHLLDLESKARAANKGLWKEDHYSVKDARHLHLSAIVSTYQLISGTVRSVSRRPEKTSYLNFGRNWNEDFTVTLSKKSLASWEGINKSLDELDQAPIYVRGWIEDRGGPLIRINHPQQLTTTRNKY